MLDVGELPVHGIHHNNNVHNILIMTIIIAIIQFLLRMHKKTPFLLPIPTEVASNVQHRLH